MDDVSAPVETGASTPSVPTETPTPTAAEIRKHRVKVFDQELEVTEDELKRDYELRRASHMRMQSAAELEKTVKEMMNRLKEDPWDVLQKNGLDPDELAEQRLMKKLERELMSPEERRAAEREAELARREAKLKEHDEKLAKEEQEALNYKAVQEIDQEIGQVLQATGLKATPRIIARVADIMLAHLDETDGERLSADKAFGLVRNEMSVEIADYLQGLPPEQLVQTLPKSVLDAIRKHELQKVTSTNPIRRKAAPTQAPSKGTPQKRASTDSFFKKLEEKLK